MAPRTGLRVTRQAQVMPTLSSIEDQVAAPTLSQVTSVDRDTVYNECKRRIDVIQPLRLISKGTYTSGRDMWVVCLQASHDENHD